MTAAAPHPVSDANARRARDDQALFERLAAGDVRAREALVQRFLPLARSLAMRYRRSAEPLDDLVQVAALGLLKAIDRFDGTREVAFTSYAVPTISGELKRHFRDRTWAVRVPRGLQERALDVDRDIARLAEQLQRQPTVREISASSGRDEEDVLEALQARHALSALSFDAPAGNGAEGSDATVGDMTGALESGYDDAEHRAMLQRMMRVLSDRERRVLRMRFEEDLTQAEIGAVIGVSQMQISRIIRQAVGRLHAMRSAGADDDHSSAVLAAP